MNLLGAGSVGRLALTRSLRVMSAQDREWLLSITYPHLQDSCKRKSVDEVKMILNEISGVDCFAVEGAAAEVAADAAPVVVVAAPRPTGVM
jgi:predicted dinucleotide-binding enzyme